MKKRLKYSATHALLSVCVALVVVSLVLGLWYPDPHRTLSGGLHLLLILVAVDIVLGPALTAVVASDKKPTAELMRDLAVIATLQLAALAYGVYTLAQARPAFVVFEVDRFQVLTAAEVSEPGFLDEAPPEFRGVLWTGPRFVVAREPTGTNERMQSLEMALRGRDLARQPRHWIPYEAGARAVWSAAKPLDQLNAAPARAAASQAQGPARAGDPAPTGVRYLPMHARQQSAAALVTEDGRIVGYRPLND